MSNLIIIFGPPAVGKMTVGQQIEAKCGYKLMTNHDTIDPLLKFFDWGSAPFLRLNNLLRKEIMEHYAQKECPGLIFTYLWDFNNPEAQEQIDQYTSYFKKAGGEVYFVELESSLDVRLERNKTPNRLANKPSKRDIPQSEARLLKIECLRTNSGDNFPHGESNYIKINNSALEPLDTALQVIRKFQIPTTD